MYNHLKNKSKQSTKKRKKICEGIENRQKMQKKFLIMAQGKDLRRYMVIRTIQVCLVVLLLVHLLVIKRNSYALDLLYVME
jgi:hypothetical protein